MIEIGEFGALPSTLKPGGNTVTRSPWLIQTGYFSPLDPDALEQRRVGGDFHLGAAEFAMVSALDLAAELLRHRLLAIADAEHRHAGLVNRLGRYAARPCRAIEAGPPERITAFGRMARKAASAFWKGTISQ